MAGRSGDSKVPSLSWRKPTWLVLERALHRAGVGAWEGGEPEQPGARKTFLPMQGEQEGPREDLSFRAKIPALSEEL